jgi:hypothetical protein
MDQRCQRMGSDSQRNKIEGRPTLASPTVGMGCVRSARVELRRRRLPIVILGSAGHPVTAFPAGAVLRLHLDYEKSVSQVESCFTRCVRK